MNFNIQASGAPSIAPIIGIGSSSKDFFGAGSVIIGSLATFADGLSTLLARSICFDTTGHRILIDNARMLRRIITNANLRGEWERFMLYGAGVFFNNAPTEHSLTKRQDKLKVQLMSAIEVFGLAQEYGQTIARYMRANADCPEVEHLADQIAWSIGQFLGKHCFAGTFSGSRNTWMELGAGAVALLGTVRAIRCTRDVIQTGTHNDNARPAYLDRLYALEAWDGFANEPERERFKYQRWLVGRLIPSIFNELKMRFWAGHKAGFRPVPINSIRKDIQNKHEGLVEILTKDTGPSSSLKSSEEKAFAKYVGSSTADLTANSEALETALKAMRNQESDPAIASQYLKHYQDKSVKDFAVSIVKSKVGIVDPLYFLIGGGKIKDRSDRWYACWSTGHDKYLFFAARACLSGAWLFPSWGRDVRDCLESCKRRRTDDHGRR